MDSSFLPMFDSNFHRVQGIIRKTSGKYAIDRHRAEAFIAGQYTPMRQDAAQDLIDNTVYITLQETNEIISRLVEMLYDQYRLNLHDGDICMYVGTPSKSFYFLNVLALHHIRRFRYKEPTVFIRDLNERTIAECGDNPIVMLDDVSYSGSQMSVLLQNIYAQIVNKGGKPVPNIFVLLIALNEFSLRKLSVVPQKRSIHLYQPSPFPILYLPERLYVPLIKTLGLARYIKLLLLFSPLSSYSFTPQVSIYLDHKIADEMSTFTRALVHGPIIPRIHFQNLYDAFAFDDDDDEGIYLTSSQLPHELTSAEKTSLVGNGKGDFFSLFSRICKEVKEDDETIQSTSSLRFCPFISSCLNYHKNKKNNVYRNKDYILLFLPENCLNIYDKGFKRICALGFGQLTDSLKVLQRYLKIIGVENQTQLEAVLPAYTRFQKHRCPKPWYKLPNIWNQTQRTRTRNSRSSNKISSHSRTHHRRSNSNKTSLSRTRKSI